MAAFASPVDVVVIGFGVGGCSMCWYLGDVGSRWQVVVVVVDVLSEMSVAGGRWWL